MADLYQCGQSPAQELQLRREINAASMRPHVSHPCARDFRMITSGIDGCNMVVLDTSAKYRPSAVSTEARDHFGYNIEDPVWRMRVASGNQLTQAIRYAGKPAGIGADRVNHHNRKYERFEHLVNLQKQRGCYSNEAEWRRVRYTELGQGRTVANTRLPDELRPRVERKVLEDGEPASIVTSKYRVVESRHPQYSGRGGEQTARSSGRGDVQPKRVRAKSAHR
ncbi:unnamed protein product [Amoebophrya sp. A25]|nr:unnamed protein product [Amoebophrya sp. A25]|eukprot:GSA25T00016682001.1